MTPPTQGRVPWLASLAARPTQRRRRRLCSVLALTVVTAAGATPTVTVPGLGVLEGRISRSGASFDVASFLGIPYGKSTAGDARWRPPQAYGAWTSPRNATRHGASCPGGIGDGFLVVPGVVESEDCLFLNIAVRGDSLAGQANLPVIVWIHGGGYNQGHAAAYDIGNIVAKATSPIVVVAINYRLNGMGFLGGALLRSRSPDGSMGNYGIQDQRLALQWVRDHISAFGGDPQQVTAMGQSAGGNSILQHFLQPASAGLFSKAIVLSGAFVGAIPLDEMEGTLQKVLTGCKCTGANETCLVACNAKTIQDVGNGRWGPVIDGVATNSSEHDAIAQGLFNTRVSSLVIGSTRDEYSYFMFQVAEMLSSEFAMDYFLGSPDAAKQLSLTNVARRTNLKRAYLDSGYQYPPDLGKYSKWWWATMRMVSDQGLGHCAARRLARGFARKGVQVYGYSWERPYPNNTVAFHGTDVAYIFDLDNIWSEASEEALAQDAINRWVRFAIAGNPNGPGMLAWPTWEADTDKILLLDNVQDGGISVTSGFRSGACAVWDSFGLGLDGPPSAAATTTLGTTTPGTGAATTTGSPRAQTTIQRPGVESQVSTAPRVPNSSWFWRVVFLGLALFDWRLGQL